MSTGPLAEVVFDALDVHGGTLPGDDELRTALAEDSRVSDWLAAHDAQVRSDERQKVEAEVRELRVELSRTFETARKLFVETRDLRIRAEKAEAELARIRALLADEGTVEKVANAICISASGWPDHHGAWTDEARAALDALAGLIGGDDA